MEGRPLLKLVFFLFAITSLAPASPALKVRISASPERKEAARTISIPLEQYVAGVLTAEAPGFTSPESLNAMAVVARTWAIHMRGRHSSEGFDLCDTTHCQRYLPGPIQPRMEAAVSQTAGELLWFRGKLAFTPFSRDCGGRTEDSGALWPELAAPYLRSHADPHCEGSADARWHFTVAWRQIEEALRAASLQTPAGLRTVSIFDRTQSGRARTLLLSGASSSIRVSASSFRFAIGRALGWNTLRSDAYEVHSTSASAVFDGRGSGHGAGLCQAGAARMGTDGSSWRQILAFYFPGTFVALNAAGLEWQRLEAEGFSLESLNPAQDRAVLDSARAIARGIEARTRLALPRPVTIRTYPDLETFRDATGEPGWVAAHTSGSAIELQPAAVLRSRGALDSTLAHELLHLLVDSNAAPGLPLWFREGLVNYLNHDRSGTPRIPSEADLRQTADPAAARRAYADATAMVAQLSRLYSEPAVLGWVRTGVPREVANASTSHAIPNTR